MSMRAHLHSASNLGSVFYSYTRTVNKHHVLAAADLRAERRKRPTKFGNLSAPSTNVNLPVNASLSARIGIVQPLHTLGVYCRSACTANSDRALSKSAQFTD